MEAENKELRFAICVNNEGYADDLKVRTVYQILPDESAAKSNYLRFIFVIPKTNENHRSTIGQRLGE